MKRFQSMHGTAGHDAIRVVHSSERQLVGKKRIKVHQLKHAKASFVIVKQKGQKVKKPLPGQEIKVHEQQLPKRPQSRKLFKKHIQARRSRQAFDCLLREQAGHTKNRRLRVSTQQTPRRPQTHSGPRSLEASVDRYGKGHFSGKSLTSDHVTTKSRCRPATAGLLEWVATVQL